MHDVKKFRTTKFSVKPEEANLLAAICIMTNPKVVVEFGTLSGLTAVNFLNSIEPDAVFYTYDLKKRQEINWIKDKRFNFINKNQTEFEHKDINYQKIDLAYIDASHNFDLNKITYELLKPHFNENALLLIHDTSKNAGRPDEIQFANFLQTFHQRIDFHCDRKGLWGLSAFQIKKNTKLLN